MKRAVAVFSIAISIGTLALFAETMQPYLINGTPVQAGTFTAVVSITTGSAGCTATLIGPKVIITAAHCADTGATSTFTLNGAKYNAKMTRSSLYPSQDHDIALGVLDNAVTTVQPMNVGGTAVVGMNIQILGYGCTQSGGGGGNDGTLRQGPNRVTGFSNFDMVSGGTPGGAALCFGDSGGPAFDITDLTNLKVLGINSKGNIKDTNYNTRTDIPESQTFFTTFAQQNSVDICGVTKQCGTGPGPTPTPTPPPGPTPGPTPPPGPTPFPTPTPPPSTGTFTVDGKIVTITGKMKPGYEPNVDYVKNFFQMTMMNLDSQVQSESDNSDSADRDKR